MSGRGRRWGRCGVRGGFNGADVLGSGSVRSSGGELGSVVLTGGGVMSGEATSETEAISDSFGSFSGREFRESSCS